MSDSAIPVVLHYSDLSSPPSGVWWWDGGKYLGSFYSGNPTLESVGETVMNSVSSRADLVDIPEFFQSLEDRAPRPDVWTTAVVKTMSPIEYLKFVQKQMKSTK